MKRVTALLLALIMVLSLAACEKAPASQDPPQEVEPTSTSESTPTPTPEPNNNADNGETQINPSADKYTCYVRNYVGRNAASVGDGWGYDEYGNGELDFIFITDDGSYVDTDDEEEMKNYVVVGQSLAPNTEIKMTYKINDDGTESDRSVVWQSYYEIELYIAKQS